MAFCDLLRSACAITTRGRRVKKIVGVIVGVFLICIFCQPQPKLLEPPLNDVPALPGFRAALQRFAGPDGILFLSAGDYGFRDVAVNLYRTSYAKFHLENHLFASFDADLCPLLSQEGANCEQYAQLNDTDHPSLFNTNAFKKKVYTKTKIILDALLLNITVIFVDLDIVFLKNPLPYLDCTSCDLVIQPDEGVNDLNTGFFLVRPTLAGKELMAKSWEKMRKSSPTLARAQQAQFNWELRKMTSQGGIKHMVLSKERFPNGRDFFNYGNRSFQGDVPCPNCVIVHNNWMRCKERKRYRFKEYGMWMVDEHGYYSDPKRQYLLYDNPDLFSDFTRTWQVEDQALRTAFIIGHILNRSVIVPKFHGDSEGRWENLGHWYDVGVLDKESQGRYREHVFLDHELVPGSVKSSLSDVYVISPNEHGSRHQDSKDNFIKTLSTPGPDLTVAEIKQWFLGPISQVSVLRFRSLYNNILVNDEILPFVEYLNQNLKRKTNGNNWCYFGFLCFGKSLVEC